MTLTELRERLANIELDELDLNNAGSWPKPIKILVLGLAFAATLLLGYYLYLGGLQKQLQAQTQQQEDLKSEFALKAFQVANLAAYQQQMVEIEATFGALLRQLPSDTEVPGLLEDISVAGQRSGVRLESVQLQAEREVEFYGELPFEILVYGDYHRLGHFVSEVAALARIVTLHDFEVAPANGELRMRILAKTYHYDDRGGR